MASFPEWPATYIALYQDFYKILRYGKELKSVFFHEFELVKENECKDVLNFSRFDFEVSYKEVHTNIADLPEATRNRVIKGSRYLRSYDGKSISVDSLLSFFFLTQLSGDLIDRVCEYLPSECITLVLESDCDAFVRSIPFEQVSKVLSFLHGIVLRIEQREKLWYSHYAATINYFHMFSIVIEDIESYFERRLDFIKHSHLVYVMQHPEMIPFRNKALSSDHELYHNPEFQDKLAYFRLVLGYMENVKDEHSTR